VGGNLTADSGNGNVTQTGVLAVTGTTGITAGTGNVMLAYAGNDLAGVVSISGNNVTLVDGAGLILGNVSATGTLSATAKDSITQAAGTNIDSTGLASFVSTTGSVSLLTSGNSFTGGSNLPQSSATTVVPPVQAPAALPVADNNPPPLQMPSSVPVAGGSGTTAATGGNSAVSSVASGSTGTNTGSSASSQPSQSSEGASGATGGSGISVSLIRPTTVEQSGIVSVLIPKDMAAAGSGFSFPLPAQVANTAGKNAVISVSTVSGQPLPGWLKFNPETMTFVASAVPDGAFPMQVVVTIGGRSTTIVISERAQ
jgi:hypothetical protein